MQVETYEVSEQYGVDKTECEAEAIALIESLGLSGQRARLAEIEGGQKIAVPYRKLTAEESFVYRRICPTRTKIEDYESGWIPLRVLQVAAHAKTMFRRLYILHPQDIRIDPVLIGTNKVESYQLDDDHLLARWGEVLLPFNELKEQALVSWRKEYREKCADIARVAGSAAQSEVPESRIIAGASLPNAYGHGF